MPPIEILPPGYGNFVTIEIDVPPNVHRYQVTIGDFSSCNYLDFLKMFMVTIGKKGKWVHCKHLYYSFYHVMHCNHRVHSSTHFEL
jgi:hypothetical protein